MNVANLVNVQTSVCKLTMCCNKLKTTIVLLKEELGGGISKNLGVHRKMRS